MRRPATLSPPGAGPAHRIPRLLGRPSLLSFKPSALLFPRCPPGPALTDWASPPRPAPPLIASRARAQRPLLAQRRCPRAPHLTEARAPPLPPPRPFPSLPGARSSAAAREAGACGAGGSAEPSGSPPLLSGGGGRGAAVPRRAGGGGGGGERWGKGEGRHASPPGAHRRRQPRGQLLLGGQR